MDAPVRLTNCQRLWLEKTKAAVRAVRISADVKTSADARFYERELDLEDERLSLYWPHTWLGKGHGGFGRVGQVEHADQLCSAAGGSSRGVLLSSQRSAVHILC